MYIKTYDIPVKGIIKDNKNVNMLFYKIRNKLFLQYIIKMFVETFTS